MQQGDRMRAGRQINKLMSAVALYWLALSCCYAGSEAPAPAASPKMSIEDYMQQLSTVPFVLNRRDPFVKATAPFLEVKSPETINTSASLLERYPLKSYVLMATLIGEVYSRALVKIPGEEKILIIRERDRIGNQGGFVKKIIKDKVLVEEMKRSDRGFVDKVEAALTLQSNNVPLEALAPPKEETGGK